MTDLPLTDEFAATPHRFLWHHPTRTAILSDLHLGIETTLRRQGIAFPPTNIQALHLAWNAMTTRLQNAGRLIIAGDLFDSPSPSPDDIAAARQLLNTLPPQTAITLLAGNHDPALPLLQELFKDTRAVIAPSTNIGAWRILHGHQRTDLAHPAAPPPQGIIVGHQHPAVILATRLQSAKMICYAHCTIRLNNKKIPLIALPAFSRMPLGSNLLTDRNWILDFPRPADADIRIAGIIEGNTPPRVLDFGPLNTLMNP